MCDYGYEAPQELTREQLLQHVQFWKNSRERWMKYSEKMEPERDEARGVLREVLCYLPPMIQSGLKERFGWLVPGPDLEGEPR